MTDTILRGFDPYRGDDGTDILATIGEDGTITVALRAGHDRTSRTWGPPVEMTVVQ
jgi:hypothetical protein